MSSDGVLRDFGNGWVLMRDEYTGSEYYANVDTQESRWEVPSEVQTILDTEAQREAEKDRLQHQAFARSQSAASAASSEEPELVDEAQRASSTCSLEPLWLEIKDATSGRYYYYNVDEGTTSWDRPQDTTVYRKELDESSGHHYYINLDTNESSWDLPERRPSSAGQAEPPQPAVPEPRPAVAQPQPAVAQPQPAVAQPQPAVAQSQPAVAQSQRAAAPLHEAVAQTGGALPPKPTAPASRPPPPDVQQQQALSHSLSPPGSASSDDEFRRTSFSQSLRSGLVLTATATSSTRARSPTPPTPPVAAKPTAANTSMAAMGGRAGAHGLPLDLQKDIWKFKLENYAEKFFRKRGGFFRKKSKRSLLTFSSTLIKKPLNKLNNPLLIKIALTNFKYIMSYMGDHKEVKPKKEALLAILENGREHEEIRDEIYCQLCRQLTGNRNNKSVIAGFEILYMCISCFVPTTNFADYFESFIAEQCAQDNRIIARCAKMCQSRYAWSKTGQLRDSLPSDTELECLPESVASGGLFHTPLSEMMLLQATTDPEEKVPKLFYVLTQAILDCNGTQTQGIFRHEADREEINFQKSKVIDGATALSSDDPHVAACLFKQWLRSFAEPLVPVHFYDEALSTAENPGDAVFLVQRLPGENQALIRKLVVFLKEFVREENQRITRMTVENLAIVFSPALLRNPGMNPELMLRNNELENRFAQHLIVHLSS